MSDVYSHPDRLLTDHSNEVVDYMSLLDGGDERDLHEIIGWCHDIGKAQPTWQSYLLDGGKQVGHSVIGGLVAYWVGVQQEYAVPDRIGMLYAVARHHSNFGFRNNYRDNIVEYIYHKFVDGNIGDGIDTIISSDEHATVAQTCVESCGGDWDDFVSAYCSGRIEHQLQDDISGLFEYDESVVEGMYGSILGLWGTLITADTASASGLPISYFDVKNGHINSPSDRDFIRHEAQLFRGAQDTDMSVSKLNTMRDQAFWDIANAIDSDSGNGDMYSITLPTGGGKTIAGLMAAHKLKPDTGRVIYALPFTSIIDQTVGTVSDILDVCVTDPELTAHHHLSTTKTNTNTDGVSQATEEKMAHMWHSPLVISTFHQLFESVINPTKKDGLKLPQLNNSVIVLDEPQTLPVDRWEILLDAIDVLISDFDATVITMTATQPRLFSDRFDVTELVPSPEQYFSADCFDRVTYHFDPSITNPTHSAQLFSNIDSWLTEYGSGMYISNTISNCEEMFARGVQQYNYTGVMSDYYSILQDADQYTDSEDELTEQIHNKLENVCKNVDKPAFILTSRYRPIDRERIIDFITHTEQDVYLFATKLVEAGVDISFKNVVADFSPLPNIIQSAGRCNRNNEYESGNVHIVRVEDDNYTPSSIHKQSTQATNPLSLTKDVLKPYIGSSVPESTINTLTDDYYTKYVLPTMTLSPTGLQDCLVGSNMIPQLIDSPQNVRVFVQITISDKLLKQQYQTALDNANFDLAKQLQPAIQTRTVSYPLYGDDNPFASNTLLHPNDPIRVTEWGNADYVPIGGLQKAQMVTHRLI